MRPDRLIVEMEEDNIMNGEIVELLEQLDSLLLETNSYDSKMELEHITYKNERRYTSHMPLGTHCYMSVVTYDGLRKYFYGDSLIEVIKQIVQYMSEGYREDS